MDGATISVSAMISIRMPSASSITSYALTAYLVRVRVMFCMIFSFRLVSNHADAFNYKTLPVYVHWR
ncbi:hypothetical protein EVA_12317 [gut metagenome]|uniref:Uncharacterized protein n=1 Tax=gut metagenome TaxID=749906 RepID=J9CHR2_9ZZZZ